MIMAQEEMNGDRASQLETGVLRKFGGDRVNPGQNPGFSCLASHSRMGAIGLGGLPIPTQTSLYILHSYYKIKFVKRKPMYTLTRTTNMEVTSIRLERELKEKLKDLAGNQGYQALIRDVLWHYVQQKSGDYQPEFSVKDIRASVAATAQHDERCALTGKVIRSQEPMLLGFTTDGVMVPLSIGSLSR